MNDEQYLDLCSRIENVGLVRPFWNHESFHENLWKERDITVLICQRKTKNETRLCLESLLNFYPDIPVLVVDGDSNDDSTLYLNVKSSLYKNVSVWHRTGRNSHGETMDEAINHHIKTKYVLLMDSDIITVRGGWIEEMLNQFKNDDKLYATGTRMLVTRKGEACGVPNDEEDVLLYAHPSLSIYDTYVYRQLYKFVDHGAACCHNNTDAEIHGYKIGYYPTDKYVAHLSGSSWCIPKTIWQHDLNVMSRPLVTFILHSQNGTIEKQSYDDFDVVLSSTNCNENVVVHGREPVSIKNDIFKIRFNILGEYVCELNDGYFIDNDFIETVAIEVSNNPSDSINIHGYNLTRRKLWQSTTALK